MFRSLFNPDAFFWRMLSRIVDIIGLSLFWAALCLPVVTIGPATAALYYTCVRTFRQDEEKPFKTMAYAFKDNIKRGIPVTLIWIPIVVFMYFALRTLANLSDTNFGIMMFVAYYIIMLIPVGVMLYMFPILGRFDLKVKDLFSTAFSLAMGHLPSTIAVDAIVLILLNLTLRYWFPILVTPVCCALLVSLFLERIFKKHLTIEERAALEHKTVEELQEKEARKLSKKGRR